MYFSASQAVLVAVVLPSSSTDAPLWCSLHLHAYGGAKPVPCILHTSKAVWFDKSLPPLDRLALPADILNANWQ